MKDEGLGSWLGAHRVFHESLRARGSKEPRESQGVASRLKSQSWGGRAVNPRSIWFVRLIERASVFSEGPASICKMVTCVHVTHTVPQIKYVEIQLTKMSKLLYWQHWGARRKHDETDDTQDVWIIMISVLSSQLDLAIRHSQVQDLSIFLFAEIYTCGPTRCLVDACGDAWPKFALQHPHVGSKESTPVCSDLYTPGSGGGERL